MLSCRQGGVARAWKETDPAEDEQPGLQQASAGSAESEAEPSGLSARYVDDDSDDGWGGWGEAVSRSNHNNSSVGAEQDGNSVPSVSPSDAEVVSRCARRPYRHQ